MAQTLQLNPGESLGPQAPAAPQLAAGESLGPQAQPPAQGAQPTVEAPKAPQSFAERMNDMIQGTAKGVLEGAKNEAIGTVGGAESLIGQAINKIPGVGEYLAPSSGLERERQLLVDHAKAPQGTAEKVGGGLMEVAEWEAGEGALAGLAKMAKVAKLAPELLQLAEKFPKTYKILAGGAKGAAVGGALGASKAAGEGKDAGEAIDEGKDSALAGGAIGATMGAVEGLTSKDSKAARSLVNKSVGANTRDVTFANPAVGILGEGIKTPLTGDLEQYKGALRSGKTEAEAMQAAGGRIAAVGRSINEIKPQLDALLDGSKARISVNDAIIKPLTAAQVEIDNHLAMGRDEKDIAIGKLEDLQREMTLNLGKFMSPKEASAIKSAIGDRVNWGGTSAVTDEVKPVYRQLYGSLKQAVHDAVPGSSGYDERLTNLMAARSDLLKSARQEEVSSTVADSGHILPFFQRELGRVIPAIHALFAWAPTRATVGAGATSAVRQSGFRGAVEQIPGIPLLEEGYVRFRASSDGSIHEVPTEQLGAARRIDPGLMVMPREEKA